MNKHTFGNSFIVVFIVSITLCAWWGLLVLLGGRAPHGPPWLRAWVYVHAGCGEEASLSTNQLGRNICSRTAGLLFRSQVALLFGHPSYIRPVTIIGFQWSLIRVDQIFCTVGYYTIQRRSCTQRKARRKLAPLIMTDMHLTSVDNDSVK